MKRMKKMRKSDYLLLLGIVLIFLIGIFLIFYYFNSVKNECLSNPFVYGAKQIEKSTGFEFIGQGFLKTEGVMPFIFFNSTTSGWVNP